MKQILKHILHDLNKYRDQINCCYECIVHDLRSGEQPQDYDINELNEVSLKFSMLAKQLASELKDGANDEARQ